MNRPVSGIVTDRVAWPSNATTRLTVLTRPRRAQIELVLATALYLGFACYLTWPLITHLTHSIYGAPGDPYGTMAFFGNLVAHHQNPFLPGTVSQFAAPVGLPIPWPRDLASAPEISSLYLLTAGFGEISAYGLYTLAGYVLTGAVTFLFVRRLTKNSWAALIAGWVFAFYPFAALNGQGHLDFVHGWVLVLAVWRMLELLWYPTRRNGLLAGLAVALGMWWSPYFILFVGVTYVTVTLAAMLIAWRDGSLRSVLVPQLIAALIVLVFVAGLGALTTAGAGEGIGVRTHSVRELKFYGARPLEYVLPDVQSPLFGSDTKSYLERYPLEGKGIETTLYVGITIMLLALVALVAFVRRRLTPRLSRAVVVLSLIAVVAVITSMPPEARVFGALIPFPSHFISQVTETWRVYSRFVMVVMLALSALAAIGLDSLTRGRAPWVRITIMSLATIAIPLDLWAPQHGHVNKIPSHGIYQTLASQPMGMVAEYPLGPSSYNVYGDIFFQNAYNKPIINGYIGGSFQEQLAFSLSNLAAPTTASRLATLGVRYVIVDAEPLSWGWPQSGNPGPGYRLIAHEPYADLYAVTALPSSTALVTTGEGFKAVHLTDAGSVDWLSQLEGKIELIGLCASCEGTLSMTLTSARQPHQVRIFTNNGHPIIHGTVGTSTNVSIPLRFSKRVTLRLSATPGPQPVGDGVGNTSVSIQVTKLEFVSAPASSDSSLPNAQREAG